MFIVHEGAVEVKSSTERLKLKGNWEVRECLDCGRQIAKLKQ